jgi:alanine-synthesizing transaminase
MLLEQASVAVSPGVGFGEYGEGHVRIALVENEQRIRQAARNIRKFLAESAKSLHNVIPLASKATRTL